MATAEQLVGSKKERAYASILAHRDDKNPIGYDAPAVRAENPDISESYISKKGKELRVNNWQSKNGGKPETPGPKPAAAGGAPTKHEGALTTVSGFNTIYAFQIGQVKEVLNPNDLLVAYQVYLRLKQKWGWPWSYSGLLRAGARFYGALYDLAKEDTDAESNPTSERGGVSKDGPGGEATLEEAAGNG